jgi:trehalose-6-phosphate synthase
MPDKLQSAGCPPICSSFDKISLPPIIYRTKATPFHNFIDILCFHNGYIHTSLRTIFCDDLSWSQADEGR